MKTSSLLKLFASACVAAICLASCGGNTGSEEEQTSVFDVKVRLINVGAEGGRLSVDYSIKGAKEGNTADVTASDDWIHLGKAYSTTFSIDVDKNESGEDRTGKVSMTCPGVQPLTLVISQSKEGSTSPTYNKFKIEVSEITTSSARVVITPVDAAETYLYSIVSKADYDKFSSPEKYIQRRVEQIKDLCAVYGVSPASFLTKGSFDTATLEAGRKTTIFDNTTYYAAAFDLSFDAKGNASYSGKIDLCEFHSKKATPVNMSFSLNMSGTHLNVSSTSASDTWICDALTKESWDEFASPEEVAHTYISQMTQYGSLTLYSGSQSVNVANSLSEKGKEYVAFAVGYRQSDTDGGLTTEVKYITFKY